ncbi:MAG TPA: sucrase ferredoxin [Pyrinomonadaceae bacterium]|jgi:hypothetical protein
MSQPFFYCSELSRRHAEKTFGTASTGEVWLLIEYPYWWGAKAFHESGLSTAVKAHLNKALKTIPRSRLLFIKQDRVRGRELKIFLVRSSETHPSAVQLTVKDYYELLDVDFASAIRSPQNETILRSPLYLICTHGRRDKCCAKFGYPLYKALRKEMGEGVWQSSHVGGDRFAANLICFPHGLFYAHVTEESARTIIDEYNRRRLVLDKYRGRACYSHPAQAADFFIRRETGIAGIDGLRYLDCERQDDLTWRVRFMARDGESIHEASVSRVMSEYQSYTTCHSTEEKSMVQYRLDEYRSMRL